MILQIWSFKTFDLTEYLTASALMIVGGILGVLFVTVLRRVMVEDHVAAVPESVAAAEIHKAGQRGADAAMHLFSAMGVGALVKLLGDAGVFAPRNDFTLAVGELKESFVRLGLKASAATIPAGGVTTFRRPAVSPAYLGVGYIIGPELGALNFAGGAARLGAVRPAADLLPRAAARAARTPPRTARTSWAAWPATLWRFIVRPIAVGGMLVGASFTLFRMRKNLAIGLKRGVADLQKSAAAKAATERTERDLSFKIVLARHRVVFVLMIALYLYFTKVAAGRVLRGDRDARRPASSSPPSPATWSA